MEILWLFRLVDRIAYAMFTVVSPTSRVFYVRGRHLYDNNREKVILRGINLMLLDDWDFPRRGDKLDELAKTGANAVRIQWYADYGNTARPDYDISHLDAFLDRCRVKELIPIVELHDWTGDDYTQTVNDELIEWWTRPDVVRVLGRHERYLIINLANELGRYRLFNPRPTPAQQAAALDRFKNNYKTAITSIRNRGLRMPIMIDAPDYGQTIDVFTISTSINALPSIGQAVIGWLRDLVLLRDPTVARLDMPSNVGQELIALDPRHNLLLSVHSYWAGHDGRPEIDVAVQTNLPIVFGEIANKQEGFNIPCYYDLDGTGQNNPPTIPGGFRYQDLLRDYLKPKEIGWLAWAWDKDSCAARRMTPNGNYTSRADLTPYGDDILFNSDYGLEFWAEKATSLPGAPPLFPGQTLPTTL